MNVFSNAVFFPFFVHSMVLIDFSMLAYFDGKDILSTFADDVYGDSSLLDFVVHCLRYDDIVHKEDSIGYRVFFSTYVWVSSVHTIPSTYLRFVFCSSN